MFSLYLCKVVAQEEVVWGGGTEYENSIREEPFGDDMGFWGFRVNNYPADHAANEFRQVSQESDVEESPIQE